MSRVDAAWPHAGPAYVPLAGRVLLVEDNDSVRLAIRRALAGAGLKVVEARSGDAAAGLIASDECLDLLVTDMRMPGARDGVALAEEWRRCWPGRPVLFVSGSFDERLNPASLGPHEALLAKPFGRADLVRAVRQLLDQASGQHNQRH